MANWMGSARSNYVHVKNRESFLKWAHTLPAVEVVERDGAFALLSVSDNGDWPSFRNFDDPHEEGIDLAAEIAEHLAEGQVLIFQEVGSEKLRYLSGWAKAVNAAGETLQVSIEDIYELVEKQWNCKPSEAKY